MRPLITLAPCFSARSRRYASITSRLQGQHSACTCLQGQHNACTCLKQQDESVQQWVKSSTVAATHNMVLCIQCESVQQRCMQQSGAIWTETPSSIHVGQVGCLIDCLSSNHPPAHADVLGLAEGLADIHLAVAGANHLHLGDLQQHRSVTHEHSTDFTPLIPIFTPLIPDAPLVYTSGIDTQISCLFTNFTKWFSHKATK